MSDARTPAAVDALHCLAILDQVPNEPAEERQIAVAVAQVHATLAVAEAIHALRDGEGWCPPWLNDQQPNS